MLMMVMAVVMAVVVVEASKQYEIPYTKVSNFKSLLKAQAVPQAAATGVLLGRRT